MIIFDNIARKVLTKEQLELKPILEEFSKTHFLAGGTAIALSLGHRKSIDFDFFKMGKQGSGKEIAKRIESAGFNLDRESDLNFLSDEEESEATLYFNGVKVQLMDFSRNPFDVEVFIPTERKICGEIKTASMIDLAAMKIYATMYRKKWKDAVDLYFIMKKEKISFFDILTRAKNIFKSLYREEASLETILEDDWDLSEKVEYVDDFSLSDKKIRNFLIKKVKEHLAVLGNDVK